MILTIDVGNTRVKWGFFNTKGELAKTGACFHHEITHIKFCADPASILISNVAGEGIKKELESILPERCPVDWIKAKRSQCGVKNNYIQAEQLGADRWAGLIAAWQIKRAPCVVVSAGTALTVDALGEGGEFLGGIILPGLDLMQQSLGSATAQLPEIKSERLKFCALNQAQNIFAHNTLDAIHAGSLYASCGAIMQMYTALTLQCKVAPFIVMGGGNADIIKDNFSDGMAKQVSIMDNMVLHGLYYIATLSEVEP